MSYQYCENTLKIMGTSRPLKSHKHHSQHCGSWSSTGFSHSTLPSLHFPPKHPHFHQHHSSPTTDLRGRRASSQPWFLITGSGCLLSRSLTPMWEMVDVPCFHWSATTVLHINAAPGGAAKRGCSCKTEAVERKCVYLKFIASHPHIKHCYLNQVSLGRQLLSTEERELNPKVSPAFQSPKALILMI